MFPCHADAGVGDKVSKLAEWDFVQWDVAAGALDPHIVGVAVKPLQQKSLSSGSEFSVEKETFQQLMKSNKGKGGKGGSGFRK